MVIYTKKGDKGETKVFDKKTGELTGISKRSCKIRAIGAIDELNSYLGVVVAENTDKKLQKRLREVQGDLFTINSILAGGNLKLSNTLVKEMEKEIDEWEGSLPVLKNFIYYGGSKVSSMVFYARALCRKAERELVRFNEEEDADSSSIKYQISNILIYINRLSDWLFMLGRKVNFDQKEKESYWMGSKGK